MKRTSSWVLVLKGLVGLHRTFIELNFSFFSVTGWGINLDYRDIEWFPMEMNKDHSVVFEIGSNVAFQTLLLTMMATPILLRDSIPQ